MRRSNFALRLQPSLLEEARKAAESEGVALNQLINVAVAEKILLCVRRNIFLSARGGQIEKKRFVSWIERAGAILPSREMNFPQQKAGLPRKESLLEKRSPKVLPLRSGARKGPGDPRVLPSRSCPALQMPEVARKETL